MYKPETPGDLHAQEGIQAYDNQDYELCVEELEQAVDLELMEYQLDEVYTILGNAYDKLEFYEQAIEAHKMALGINPNNYKAWVNLGIVYRLTSELKEAEKCYQKALQISPCYPQLHASLGALYIFTGEPHKAIKALKKSIQLDAQLPVAHSNIALAYAMVGLFEAAGNSLRQAVVLGYQNWEAIRDRINNLRSLEEGGVLPRKRYTVTSDDDVIREEKEYRLLLKEWGVHYPIEEAFPDNGPPLWINRTEAQRFADEMMKRTAYNNTYWFVVES